MCSQSRPGSDVDGIVETPVKGYETPQHLSVGRVRNGIYFQMGDVALPYRNLRAARFADG
ncbi:hypothetical protein [Ruegeria arenilitoris]|uniref:hypothetical protein n=1 Tax=Ruegeria arenilitoris TaxID=1173585 RepID=UPI00147E5AA0|nr:hypothetical protein [Ruegeria arenilitoris]